MKIKTSEYISEQVKNWTKDNQQLGLFVSNVYIYSFQKTLKRLSDKKRNLDDQLMTGNFDFEVFQDLKKIKREFKNYSNDLIMTIEDFDEISCSYRETTH